MNKVVVSLSLAMIDLIVGDIYERLDTQQRRGQFTDLRLAPHRAPNTGLSGHCSPCTVPSATLSHQPEVGELTSLECRFVIFPYGFVGQPFRDQPPCAAAPSSHQQAGQANRPFLQTGQPTRGGSARQHTVQLTSERRGIFYFLGRRTRGTRLGRLSWSPMGILMLCTCYVYAGRLVASCAGMKICGFSYTFPTLPRPGAPVSASPTICSSLPRLHCNA